MVRELCMCILFLPFAVLCSVVLYCAVLGMNVLYCTLRSVCVCVDDLCLGENSDADRDPSQRALHMRLSSGFTHCSLALSLALSQLPVFNVFVN